MFRGSVNGTGYLIHSPVFPSLPPHPSLASPCAITFQLESTRRTPAYSPLSFMNLSHRGNSVEEIGVKSLARSWQLFSLRRLLLKGSRMLEITTLRIRRVTLYTAPQPRGYGPPSLPFLCHDCRFPLL